MISPAKTLVRAPRVCDRWRAARLPVWKREGYADVVAGETSIDPADEARIRARDPHAPVLAYYGQMAEPLPAGSSPQDYIHNPAQGEILAAVARERGAALTLRTAADTGGWRGFLGETVAFLAGHLGR